MKTSKLSFFLISLAVMIATSSATETGSSCSTTEDCPDLHSCQANVCVHKELFPITFREVMGTILILLLNCIMTAGGVGAGAAYVPYVILIFESTLKQAIFIAYACVFGGGLGNLTNIIRLRNPKTKRFMINYDVNLIILPALMIGVVIGVTVSRTLPPFVTNLILLLVLGYSVYKNVGKIKANLAKEKKERAAKAQQQQKAIEVVPTELVPLETPKQEEVKIPESEENQALTPHCEEKESKEPQVLIEAAPVVKASSISSHENATSAGHETRQDAISERRERIMNRETKFPYHKLRELLVNVIIIIVVGIIRGSKNFSPVVGVEWTCGWDFLWFGLGILFFSLALVRSVYLVHKWQKEKLEVGYEFLPEEPLLDRKRTLTLIIGSTIVGIIGALIALGGALIISPILLDMHIPPAFSAATTGVFMIFSMFSAMFSTILDGHLSWQQIVWFLPLSFLFSYTSSRIVNYYVKRTGRQSTVIMTVTMGALLGFLCLLAIFIKSLAEDFHSQVQFKSIC